MERPLETFLGAGRRIGARSPEERLAVLRDLAGALERIQSLSREERLNALAEAQDTVAELEQRARAAMAEWEDAQIWVQMMERVIRENGAHAAAEGDAGGIGARASARRNEIRLAEDTRDAIVAVMQQHPNPEHAWRPIEIREAFNRADRPGSKSMIETALLRMARDEEIKKTGRGLYRLWLEEELQEGVVDEE